MLKKKVGMWRKKVGGDGKDGGETSEEVEVTLSWETRREDLS